MDEFLSWNYHVSSVCQRTYYTLHRLYKFRSLSLQATRIRLVSSLIWPIFDYCMVVCCNMSEEYLNRLLVSPNNCLRYIFNVKRREHITPYYNKLGWLTIKERRDLFICVMTHKVLHGHGPPYLSDLLVLLAGACKRNTRAHSMSLKAPLVGRQIYENSFSVMAYHLWSSLDSNLCTLRLTALFKMKVEQKYFIKYAVVK
jgi:hypothetical protein